MNRPPHTRPAEPDFDLLQFVVVSAVAVACLAVCLPALVVAIPLGLAIEDGGLRRWPSLVVGATLTGLVVLAGGWDAYRHTIVSFWAHLRFHHPFRPVELLSLLPLGAAGGILAAPLLPTIVHHRNEHEATRHYRELSQTRRSRTQAQRTVGRAGAWPESEGRTVLGVALQGVIRNWRLTHRWRPVVAAPLDAWRRQTLIVGETGSGKTVTALTLAGEALRGGWDVYWVDGKADQGTARSFLGLAEAAGVEARDGTLEPLDGWRGDPEAIVNRLLATQVFTEPYYEGIARTVLRHAVGDRPPRSFHELVARLDKRALQRAARDDTDALDALRVLPDKDVAGVRARYDGIAWAVGTTLDGTWSYEDCRAAYVPVGRPENRHQAAEVGAFLLEDVLHWALARKPPDRQALVLVDEFSKLSDRSGAAVDLVERARSFNVAVVLIAQTWASLGPDDTTRNRLAGTVGTVIAHQLKQPDEVAALAGTEWVLERTEQTHTLDHTGLGSQRAGNRYVVHPDDIRRLHQGEAFVIHGGQALKLKVRPPPVGGAE
ncbi:MAG TPA: hypothetical protein VG034_21780 [Acidimicrobiia bacterium]|jgi:hypothetical protein|nr:hypothetical protein [Acidimicrobiia bacterium]